MNIFFGFVLLFSFIALVRCAADEPNCPSGGLNCFSDMQCGGTRGSCEGEKRTCECFPPYAGEDCSYVRLKQSTALALSFVLGPYGADRFYLGDSSELAVVPQSVSVCFACKMRATVRRASHTAARKTARSGGRVHGRTERSPLTSNAAAFGVMKLLLSLVLCLLPCIPVCCAMCRRTKKDSPFRGGYIGPCVVFFVAYLGVIIWWAHDWVNIALDNVVDQNGCGLFSPE
eukprot:TRINITY_DN1291_c0_g1_i2.p1 TRINITY_DN1291_c0_g1~~TRINITY_DN1291_c0_g1_i2.p1  ORF type:complete len:230 (-),score=41.07 TRINITY_DN1291_c0_g1_i2:4-693(-)